jgi:hypothetical protein
VNFYTALCSDRLRVTSPFPSSDALPHVQFGADVPIDLPIYGLYLDAERVGGDHWAIVVSSFPDDGPALLIKRRSREVITLPVPHGPNSVFVEADGTVSWVRKGGAWVDFLGDRPSESCDGRHPLAPDLGARAEWDGILVVPQAPKGPWQIAEDGTTPDGFTRILARVNHGPLLKVFEGFCPLPAKFVSYDDGTCEVAIQLPKDESTFFIHSNSFTRYEKPALRIPTFNRASHRMAISIAAEPHTPQLAGDQWPFEASSLGVLLHTRKFSLDKFHGSNIAMARAHNAILYVLPDHEDPDVADFAVEGDVLQIPMAELYPLRGESNGAFAERCERTLKTASRVSDVLAVYACGFMGLGTDGARTEQQVLDGLKIVADACIRWKVRFVTIFIWTRGAGDGIAHSDALTEAVIRWRDSVPDFTDYLEPAELAPVVVAPPATQPTPSAPKPLPPAPRPEPPPMPTPEPEVIYPSPTQAEVDAWKHGRAALEADLVNAEARLAQLRRGRSPGLVREQERIIIGIKRALPAWPWPHVPEGEAATPIVKAPAVIIISRPEAVIRGVGCSEYGQLANPKVDYKAFNEAIAEEGCTHTRINLLNAWATGLGTPGTIDGFVPFNRRASGEWDLFDWRGDYFERLSNIADDCNRRGIVPVFSLWELYMWSTRKGGVPPQHLQPWQNNVNGVFWSDAESDEVWGKLATPGDWFWQFAVEFEKAVRGKSVAVETANEMPEKALHARIFDAFRSAGFNGPIQCNRHEDKPSMYANMISGVEPGIMDTRDYATIAFHGRANMSYLDDVEDEPSQRPSTWRAMWDHTYAGPKYDFSKIVLSSDGCRSYNDRVDTYDWNALTPVAVHAIEHGANYEHQATTKMRWFLEGAFRAEDVHDFDSRLLKPAVAAWKNR